MLMVDFGPLRKMPYRGGVIMLPEFTLHVQCSWRISRRDRIVLGAMDFYYSPKHRSLTHWSKRGKNRFDKISRKLNRQFKSRPSRVLSGVADAFGGFSLSLSHQYRLELFPEDGSNGAHEHWRLFCPGTKQRHFVVP